MKQLQRSVQGCHQFDDQLNPEAEAILALVETIVGELSQPITVVSGLSELLLSENVQREQAGKDLMTILKQTDRIKETLETVNYVTNYDTTSLGHAYLLGSSIRKKSVEQIA